MKITLIGSTKFKDKFIEANTELTSAGHVVYSVAFYGHADNAPLTDRLKETLDLVHLKKILESDAVMLITDDTKYIGDSTRRELKWAVLTGKKLWHWSSDHDRVLILKLHRSEFSTALKPEDWA